MAGVVTVLHFVCVCDFTLILGDFLTTIIIMAFNILIIAAIQKPFVTPASAIKVLCVQCHEHSVIFLILLHLLTSVGTAPAVGAVIQEWIKTNKTKVCFTTSLTEEAQVRNTWYLIT